MDNQCAGRTGGEAWRSGLSFSGYYGALFLVLGVQLPYLSVWLDGRGFSAVEIALMMSSPLWIRMIVGPGFALLADRTGQQRAVVVGLALAALASTVGLLGATSFWLVLSLVTVLLIASQAALPLVDALAIDTARRRHLDYGRMRLWGSLTFIAANLVGGWALAKAGSDVVMWLILAAAAATTLAALAIDRKSDGTVATTAARALAPAKSAGTTEGPATVVAAPATSLRDGLVALARSPSYWLLVVAAGAIQSSHAVYYTFSVLHWQGLGWSSGWIGALWALGVITEVALFAMSGRVVVLIGARGLLLVGAGAAVLRWAAMAAEPGPFAAIPLQMMHALSYGATHLGTVHLIQVLAPAGQAGTAQAVNASLVGGLAMALAVLVAGAAYAAHGALAYLAMAALAVVGVIAAAAIRPTRRETEAR